MAGKGKQLKRKRFSAGISQDFLAKRLGKGFDRAKLSRFENGFLDLPAVQVEKIGAALDALIVLKMQAQQAAEAAGWPAEI